MLRVVGVVVLAFALLNVSSAVNLLGLSGGAGAASGARTASANVTVADGIQTVRMTQTPSGYEPADTVLYAGLPTRWVIDGTSQFDCSAFLRVPDLGLRIDLTQGENVVDLPTLDAGTVPFTCVMGMYSGTLVVVDPPRRRGRVEVGVGAGQGCSRTLDASVPRTRAPSLDWNEP